MDTIDKAIVKLEALKRDAIPGPWTVEEKRTWSEAQVHSPNGPIADGGDYASSNATFDANTAKLIVTLYRTITAQLNILEAGRVSPAGITNKNYSAALTLAVALLQED